MKLYILYVFLIITGTVISQSVPQPLPPHGHLLYIMDFDIHPNSKSYITVGLDRQMIAWDIKTGIPFQKTKAHDAEIYSIRYDWYGDTIITAAPDSTIKIWRSSDFSLIKSIPTKTQNTYAEFGRHNHKIAAAGTDGYVSIYDKFTFEELYNFKGHEGKINCVAFSTNGSLVFTGGEDGWVYAFQYETGKRLFELNIGAPVHQINFDMFNSSMVIHAMNGKAEILLIPSFKGYGAIPVQTKSYYNTLNFVSEIDISPDNNWIAYADSMQTVFIADAKTKEARGYTTPHSDFISKVKFSFDMKYLLSLDHDQKMVIASLHNFDFETSKQMPVRIAKQLTDYPESLFFTNDNVLNIRGFYAYTWNLTNGNMETLPVNLNYEKQLKNTLHFINSKAFKVWYDAEQDIVLIQDKKDDHFKDPLNYAFNEKRNLLWIHDGLNYIVIDVEVKESLSEGKWKVDIDFEKLEVLDENTLIGISENELFKMSITEKSISEKWKIDIPNLVDFDCKNQEIAVGTTGSKLLFYSLDGEKTNSWEGERGGFQNVKFHPTQNQIAVNSFDGKFKIYDLSTQKITFQKAIESSNIKAITFSNDGLLAAIIEGNSVVKVFDLHRKNAPQLFEIYTMKENGMVAFNQDSYYQSTKNAHQNLAYLYQDKIYSCQQFDAIYNQPAIVLSNSPYADEWYVNMLTQAYNKRVKNIGDVPSINNNESIPLAQIKNASSFPNVIEENEITLNLMASDSTEGLSRVNLYINNVPFFGKEGMKVNGLSHVNKLTFTLPEGKNKIRWTATNANGIESLQDELSITVIAGEKPNLYIASIGVSEYNDSRFNLDYPAKDATDIIENFAKSGQYKKVYQTQLTNKKVTKDEVLELRNFFEKAKANDVVVLFVAGHGLLNEDLDYYFATHDIDFNNPSEKGLAYASLEKLLDGLTALKKVFLMDTCHSGEVDEDEVELTAENESFNGDVKFRTVGKGVRTKEGISTIKASELAKEMFADMRDGAGITVISSAGGAEFAMESDQWKNGLFTYCILEGLATKNADANADGAVSISELQWYVKENVTRLSKGKQIPTYRTENIEMDFLLY